MSHNFDNLGRLDGHAARRSLVQATIAVAFAAAAALTASMTEADASAREISVSSYSFADSLVANNTLERSSAFSPFGGGVAQQCLVHCGPAAGTFIVRRSDLLTSNTADVSARKTADAAGHPMGVGGAIVVERLETDSAGLTNWVVMSERTTDENGSHSWSLLSGAPSDTPWLPNDLYRFEGSSFSTDLLAETATTPEASTWVMMLIGFAGLGTAGYRNSKKPWRAIQFPKRVTSQ